MWSAPSAPTSAGPEALFLAETAGLVPMPWQRFVCEHGLGENADGSWAVLSLLLIVPRQNGKGTVIEIIELYALFELGQNVYHTAHLFATSRKAFKRLWSLIKRTPSLLRRVAGKPHQTADQITITLTSGAFISFVARSARMGRGFDDVDLLVLDEALFLEAATVEAVVSGMTTRPKPLIVYASSAGVVGSRLLRNLRQRMIDGDRTLAGFEFSVDPELVKTENFDPVSVEVLAQSNPSLADRKPGLVTVDWCRGELAELGLAGYLRERGGLFDEDPDEAKRVIPAAAWSRREASTELRLAALEHAPGGQVAFAIAAAWPDAESTAVVVARRMPAGLVVQVVEHRRGTTWAVARARGLAERHNAPVVVDPGGPAGHLVAQLESVEDGGFPVEVVQPTMRQVGHGSKDFLLGVTGDEPYVLHFAQASLDAAAAAAGRRPLGDLWTWQRRGEVDISPLEAASLAAWWVEQMPPALEPVSAGGDLVLVSSGGDVARMGF